MSENPLNHPVLVEKIVDTFGLVAKIDEKIDQLSKQLPGLESRVENHDKRITTLEQKVLQEDVATLRKDAVNLRKDVDTMKSKWRIVAWVGSGLVAAATAVMSLDMAVIVRVAKAAVGL